MATPVDESPLLREPELAPLTVSDSRKSFSVYLKLFLIFASTIIFFLGIIVLCGWFWYYPQISPPSISIEKFYVPGLDTASNDTEIISAMTISFELWFSYFSGINQRYERGIYYDDIKLAFYYYNTKSNVLIGNISIPAFRQNPYFLLDFNMPRELRLLRYLGMKLEQRFQMGARSCFMSI